VHQVTFPLQKTTAELFTQWLKDYVRESRFFTFYARGKWFLIDRVRPWPSLARPKAVGIGAVESPSTARRLFGLIRIKQRLPDVISFKIQQLDLDRMEVTATCRYKRHSELMRYYQELLINIAQKWPSAAEVIADCFPQDLPDPLSLRKLALLKTDVVGFECLLRRFAEEFAQRDDSATDVKVEQQDVPRDPVWLDRVGRLTEWEVSYWSIAFGTVQEFRPYDFYRSIVLTEEVYQFHSLYVYPAGECLELTVPDRDMVGEYGVLFVRFIDGFLAELQRLGLATLLAGDSEGIGRGVPEAVGASDDVALLSGTSTERGERGHGTKGELAPVEQDVGGARPLPSWFPKTEKSRERWRRSYSVIVEKRQEYRADYDDARTDDPNPYIDDLRDALSVLPEWKKKPTRKTVSHIIEAGDNGWLE
jgi:hypothetical protein